MIRIRRRPGSSWVVTLLMVGTGDPVETHLGLARGKVLNDWDVLAPYAQRSKLRCQKLNFDLDDLLPDLAVVARHRSPRG